MDWRKKEKREKESRAQKTTVAAGTGSLKDGESAAAAPPNAARSDKK